jgi:amino acid transporter
MCSKAYGFRFTYAIAFAALIVGAAAEASYFGTPKGIEAGVFFFLIPLALVVINALGIEVCNPWGRSCGS